MQENGHHHVARIDDTVTPANLHERAEAIAVPDFDYVQQGIDAVVSGLSRHGHKEANDAKQATKTNEHKG